MVSEIPKGEACRAVVLGMTDYAINLFITENLFITDMLVKETCSHVASLGAKGA